MTHQMNMLKTLWAKVRQGKIKLVESEELAEETRFLVTLLPDDETFGCKGVKYH